jgi:hypothetical protein
MELQHVNVKLFVQNPEGPQGIDLEPLIPVFQSWIQEQSNGELLLDVADYRHVDAGPGVVLIGHEGNYSVDNADNRPGVRYNRKAELSGSNQDRFEQAARAALSACRRLEAEPRLDGQLRFNGQEIDIFINDRLLAPNNDETREAVASDLRIFSKKLFGGEEYSVSYERDARKLLTASLKAGKPISVTDLLQRLA